ncbi:MAG: bifunctional phosphoribosyl-AMP cyclohydrolase/phosphoribosyl-ATP diphosphatase HisIE [Clostridiales bacterium]|jgi:phosphoribosyl-ATP pyrophosphohydrolase/phosphoribosyl-AMP cyclohydrolase|nr:bifunctional phosphoribosyl-AMP cyclohydrolase/phosphoribosyl-ATP diphosphatase HisIE [Clostridiales bacterium]
MDYPKFDEKGLVPVVTQDALSGKVLMQAYMNKEAYELTVKSGEAVYYSRSRSSLWRKGETSGNTQRVTEIFLDCDKDSVLLKVIQKGAACHTGEYSCFHNPVKAFLAVANSEILYEDMAVIADRKINPVDKSYTNYLFDKGVDKICKKIGEEAAEVIIAAKNKDNDELKCELSDLIFHMQVLMTERGLALDDVFGVLKERRENERKRNY